MESKISFFMGANSPAGFVSLFDDLYNPKGTRRCYIIKGGPGTGKSRLMKKIAAAAETAREILEHAVKERFGCKVRSIELNVVQRCASHVLSLTDIEEAVSIGKRAVEVSQEGASGVMVAFKRNEGSSYSCDIVCVPVERVANEIKKVPASFINAEQNNVTDECCEYLLPLICGEYPVIWEKGLPKQIIF